jgi:hypothetical protein
MRIPMKRLAPLAVLLPVLVGESACRTTETSGPALSASVGELRVASPTQGWEVLHGSDVVGLVVFFRANGPAEDSLYMVRNVWHQDLGLIDAFGRAYRYVPHQEDPAWVGSGSVRQGVEHILGLSGCVLSEFPLAEERRPTSPGEREQRRMSPPNPLGGGS